MTDIHTEILSWIGEGQVTVDDLHAHIHNLLGDRYEIGDVGIVINDIIASGLIEVDDSNRIIAPPPVGSYLV